MECIKILKQLNERKIRGYKYLIVKKLSEGEIQEIIDCGYFVKKINNGYKITDS